MYVKMLTVICDVIYCKRESAVRTFFFMQKDEHYGYILTKYVYVHYNIYVLFDFKEFIMKKIYILLTKSGTFVSRIIRLLTADSYTHVSISFDESLRPLYSFSRKYIYRPLPAGLHKEQLDEGFFKRFDTIPCALYSLEVEDEVYIDAQNQVLSMMENAGFYRFNIIGLFLCRMNIPFKRRRHLFCSQFVSEVLKNSKALTLPKNPSLMRPADYQKLSELEHLYTGNLRNLAKKLECRNRKIKVVSTPVLKKSV